jgi:hypothetical protein
MAVEYKVKPDQGNIVNSLKVLAESDNIEELTTPTVRQAVINFARANGLPNASGLSDVPSPYPIDKDGICDMDVALGKRPYVKFQAEYIINAGFR